MKDSKIDLLARVARARAGEQRAVDVSPSSVAPPRSILSLSAASYGARPHIEATVPTGFDPLAAALFEAIVESSLLVVSASDAWNDEARRTFERLVVAACGGSVGPAQVTDLIRTLEELRAREGTAKRFEAISRYVGRTEHRAEVLRIAALLTVGQWRKDADADGSADPDPATEVGPAPKQALHTLALALGRDAAAADAALDEAKNAFSRP